MQHTATVERESATGARPAVAPKWAAVIEDRLIPLPRQVLKSRDILAQAGDPHGVLVRDYNQPIDVPIAPDAEVDLAQGNVFRIVPAGTAPCSEPPHEAPKLAFVMDDAWEITVQPTQTLESIRGLFGLPDDARVFRDFESPEDVEIHVGEKIRFSDGPVLSARVTTITVKVNRKPVRFEKRRNSGREVKQTAIDQKVDIKIDFILHRRKPDGEYGPAIDDNHVLLLRECDEFRCVAPDDVS